MVPSQNTFSPIRSATIHLAMLGGHVMEHAYARHTDPQTSHDAAATVKNITQTKQHILQILSLGDRTDEELISKYKIWGEANGWKPISESGIRSRRADLVKAGLVIDSGKTKTLPTGRQAIIWRKAND